MSIKQSSKRWQKLAGLIKEGREYPTDEKDFDLNGQDDDIYTSPDSEESFLGEPEPSDEFVPGAAAFGHSGQEEDYFDKNVESGYEIKNLSIADLIDRGYSEEEIMDFVKSTREKENLDEKLGKDLFDKEDEDNGSKPLDHSSFENKGADPEKVFADTELSQDGDTPDPDDLKLIFGDEEGEQKQEERMIGHTGGPSREGHALLTKEEHDDFDLTHLFDDPEELGDEELEQIDDEDEYVDLSTVEDELSGMYDVHSSDWKPKLDEGSEDRAGIVWHLRDKGMNDTDILENLILALSDSELYNALEEYLDDYDKTAKSLKED